MVQGGVETPRGGWREGARQPPSTRGELAPAFVRLGRASKQPCGFVDKTGELVDALFGGQLIGTGHPAIFGLLSSTMIWPSRTKTG